MAVSWLPDQLRMLRSGFARAGLPWPYNRSGSDAAENPIDYEHWARIRSVALPRNPYGRCPEGMLYCLCDFDLDLACLLEWVWWK